jgi:hypothetical protein
MAGHVSRKQAIQAYKNRPPDRGVFAVRCAATPQVWVGASMDLPAARNAIWFMLRLGRHRDAALQAAFNAHGEDAFRFEVLERLDENAEPLSVEDLLKQKTRQWADEHHAPILPR